MKAAVSPFLLQVLLLLTALRYSCLCFSGSWKEKKFKPYNFEALGVAPDCGHLHPLMKVRTQFRQIFLEMGWVSVNITVREAISQTHALKNTWNKHSAFCSFTEMPTNNFIESSFWNFDSLFQPQQHPARDQHDTFFLSGACHTFISLYPVALRPVQLVSDDHLSQTTYSRPSTRPRVPSGLPGESEEGPLRGRLRFTGVRHDHTLA